MLGVLTVATVAAGVVLAGLAVYVWRRRGSTAGLSLAVLLLAGAWWAGAYAVELSTADLVVRGHWGDLKYVGICLLPPAWLVFVVQYTGRRDWVTRRRLLLLAVEPVAVWILLAVPTTHDLVRFYPVAARGQEIPVVGSGPMFWVVLGYANALILVATVLFVRSLGRLSHVYRVAAGILLGAVLLPWAANLLHNFEVGPFARLDLTPFAFIIGSPVLVWGLFREHLINLSSIAWGQVVATMPDAVIVRDAFGRVVEANPSAVHILGRSRAELIGTDPSQLITAHAHPHGESPPAVSEWEPDDDTVLSLLVKDQVHHFDPRRHLLTDKAGTLAGDVIVLRDITARKDSETRLRHLLAERTRIALALQRSLLPGQLPTIPGCELAGLYEPAEDEIGGDFYDVFPVGGGLWGLVIADVSGKGAEAAAFTAMIRFTLRTLATESNSPSEVLAALNALLLRDSPEERFCTMVFAIARTSDCGLHLQLCLAGHHPPLVRRRDGAVEPVGVLGTALGLLPQPDLTDASVHLHPGDLLCLFTDGLVEARSLDDLFGSERAAALLSQTRDSSPRAIVDQLARAAHRFRAGPLTDDLSLLAVAVDDRLLPSQ